jgi:hypothetical protein
VANGLLSCGSSTSGRYTPSTVQSSVESRASRRGSRTANLATHSSARDALAPGQCSAAVNRRLANAAARQGGTAARGENARCSARKSMSLVHATVIAEAIVVAAVVPRGQGEAGAALLLLRGVDAVASSSGAKLSDWISAYSWFVKSVRSTLSASPGWGVTGQQKKKEKNGVTRGTEKVQRRRRAGRRRRVPSTDSTGAPNRRYAPCPERSSYAVTIQESWWRAFSACAVGPCDCCRGMSSSFLWLPFLSSSLPPPAGCGTRATRSLSTCIRSLKKSMLTRCAYFAMPWSAAGSNSVGAGFFRIRKYNTNRSFNVSVC